MLSCLVAALQVRVLWALPAFLCAAQLFIFFLSTVFLICMVCLSSLTLKQECDKMVFFTVNFDDPWLSRDVTPFRLVYALSSLVWRTSKVAASSLTLLDSRREAGKVSSNINFKGWQIHQIFSDSGSFYIEIVVVLKARDIHSSFCT